MDPSATDSVSDHGPRKVFEHRSIIPASVEAITAFHEDAGALSHLTPFPLIMHVVHDARTALTSGELVFTLWFGPVPVRWRARHEPGPTPTSFADRMIDGPLAYWRHEHLFEAVAGGVQLIDRITLAHKPGWRGWLTRLCFDGLPLRMLFMYRHWRTRRMLAGR